MNKPLFITLLIVSLLLPCSAGMRGTEWGMPKEQVRRIEKSRLIAEEDRYLCYETEISGLDTRLYFVFDHRNQLYLIN